MNIQGSRTETYLTMDRTVRREKQKVRSNTKSCRYASASGDCSKLYDKLISKNQETESTDTDMLIQRSRYYSISEISKEVQKEAKSLLNDEDSEQTQEEWEEDVTSFAALHNTLLNSLNRIDTDAMTKYAKELQSNAKEYEKELEKMGISVSETGILSITEAGIQQTDTEIWKEFVKKTNALAEKIQESAGDSLDSITTNRILHGISYNKYGEETS